MKEIKLTDNSFEDLVEGTRYNRAPAGYKNRNILYLSV